MKTISTPKPSVCSHTELGELACDPCKNGFRSEAAIKKHLNWQPFEVMKDLNFDTIITPFIIKRGSLLS